MAGDRLSITWSTRREVNSGYVLETATDQHGSVHWRTEYGPMPCHIVPSFVQSRRRVTAMQAQRAKLSYVEPEVNWEDFLRE